MNFTNMIENDHLASTPAATLYAHSPFKELRKLPPGTKGKRFEQITEDVLKKWGYDVKGRENVQHDRIVDGKKAEIKGSTLGMGYEGEWRFNFLQIRLKHDWEILILSCYWPQDARMFMLTKEQVLKLVDEGIIRRDHGGKDSDNDLYVFRGNPADLEDAVEIEPLVDKPKKASLKVTD